jgi:3-phosphoglycerate kinase
MLAARVMEDPIMEDPIAGKTAIIRISLDGGISHTAIPLITTLADAGARVVVVAGLGDPAGDINPALSLRPFTPMLEEMTGKHVTFVNESVGTGAEAKLAGVPFGEIALMENLRFPFRRTPPRNRLRHAAVGSRRLFRRCRRSAAQPARLAGRTEDNAAGTRLLGNPDHFKEEA